jgi:iron complex outermembrane receptor protein
LTLTATFFRYEVHDPAVVDRATYTLATLSEPTINTGVEAVATFRRSPFSVTATYAYVNSREGVGSDRGDIPLTPRHSAGLVGMWEREEKGRIGVEAYFTGAQRLDDNPYRSQSEPYLLFGGLVERRFGRVRLFINAESWRSSSDPVRSPRASVPGGRRSMDRRCMGAARWPCDQWRDPVVVLTVLRQCRSSSMPNRMPTLRRASQGGRSVR